MDPNVMDADTGAVTPPAPAAAPQPMATQSTPGTGTIPTQQAEQPTLQPMTTEPVRRSGVLGVLDAVTDMLAGRDKQNVTYGDNGRSVQNVPLTRGQQYAKIGLEALTGAARGAAAPPGPAHTAQGFAAGTLGAINDQKQAGEEQDENAQKQYADQQKAKLNEMNYQLGIRAIAKNDLELKNMGVKANEDAVNFSNQQIDREKTLDSYDLGTAKDAGEIADIVSKLPNWEQELYRHEGLQPHPVYDEEGNRTGIRIFLRKPDIDNQPAAQGTKVPKWVPGSKPGEDPHTEFFTPLGPNGEPATNADIDKYNRAYLNDVQTFQKNKADADYKAQQTAEAKANAEKAPALAQEAKANAARAYAEARKADRETALLGADGGTAETAGMNHQEIVKGMLDGGIDITKAVGIFKDPHAREGYIADARRADPSWTMAKYNAMRKMREDAATGKMGDQVQSFQAFTGHAVSLLNDGINKLRNTNSPLINTPINALRKSVEGQAALSEVEPGIEAVRNEYQNFLANHALQKNEIEMGNKLINEDLSPAQLQAAVKNFEKVALTKLGAVNYRYKSTVNGQDIPGLLDPNSAAAIQSMGLGDYAKHALYMNDASPNAPGAANPAAPAPPHSSAPPAGATMKVPGTGADAGKWFWSDGKNNLGPVQ